MFIGARPLHDHPPGRPIHTLHMPTEEGAGRESIPMEKNFSLSRFSPPDPTEVIFQADNIVFSAIVASLYLNEG